MTLSIPNGGTLINRWNPNYDLEGFTEAIELDEIAISDLDLIGVGAYSPLTGFLTEKDYYAVLNNMRLSSGEPWTIDRKSTRLNSSHVAISYAVFCLKKKRMIDALAYT